MLSQNTVSVYRLIVMRLKTTSLTSTGPSSLNDPASKATFYVFHAGLELLAAAVLLGVNVREMFGTGLTGDHSKKFFKKKVGVVEHNSIDSSTNLVMDVVHPTS